MSSHYDVVIASDLRDEGPAATAIAEEIEVQARLGLRTALIHIGSKDETSMPWADEIEAVVRAGLAEPVSRRTEVEATLLVLRNPACFARGGVPLRVKAKQAVMVADELPAPMPGRESLYFVHAVHKRLAEVLSVVPRWAPVSRLVRSALSTHSAIELTEDNWCDVLNADAWEAKAPSSPRQRGAIGRHLAVEDYDLWPESAESLVAVYPQNQRHVVRVLGGVAAASEIIEHRPRGWNVFRKASLPTAAFLADLDVYIHMHDSRLRRGNHREVLEALAAGLPVITHPYLREEFGDACEYAEPDEVEGVVQQILASPHRTPNRLGRERIASAHDWEHHRLRLQHLLGRDLPALTRPGPRRKRIVFMSSNGTGMGHLTRLLAIARRLPEDHEAIFLTLSTGLKAVRELDFWCDYSPSSGSAVLGGVYHAVLRARVGAVLRSLRPDALVFDGTFPYKGLRQALGDYPGVRGIWCRRGMWKAVEPEVAQGSLQFSDLFSMIIEPGDFADEDDRGATSQARAGVTRVQPIVLLDENEITGRDEARRELGIRDDDVAVLLNLGAGNINRIDGLGEIITNTLGRDPSIHLFVLKSLIANKALDLGSARVSTLEMYPLARVLKAFDFCIAAPGYNSFHELLAYGVPTAFVPNEETLLDDQLSRAAWAHRVGAAILCRADDASGIENALTGLKDPAVRDAMKKRCAELPSHGGGAGAAVAIASLIQSRLRLPSVADYNGASPPLSKRLYRAGRWVVRRSVWLKPRWPQLGGNEPEERRSLVDRARSRHGLLVVPEASLDDLEAIGHWALEQPQQMVVWAPAELVPGLHRLGLRVELITPPRGIHTVEERLAEALYSVLKERSIHSTYRLGPVYTWRGGPPT